VVVVVLLVVVVGVGVVGVQQCSPVSSMARAQGGVCAAALELVAFGT
jgi:hypothetical protein